MLPAGTGNGCAGVENRFDGEQPSQLTAAWSSGQRSCTAALLCCCGASGRETGRPRAIPNRCMLVMTGSSWGPALPFMRQQTVLLMRQWASGAAPCCSGRAWLHGAEEREASSEGRVQPKAQVQPKRSPPHLTTTLPPRHCTHKRPARSCPLSPVSTAEAGRRARAVLYSQVCSSRAAS